MIIDTLLYYGPTTRTATREEILAELEPLGLTAEGELNPSCGMWVELVVQPATYDVEGNQIQSKQVMPGLAIWITSPDIDEDLWSLPGNVARLQADREGHEAGAPDWLIRSRVDPGLMASIIIEPTYLGSNYPFGGV